MSEISECVNFLKNGFDNLTEARGAYDLTYQIVDTCYEYVKSNLDKLFLLEKSDNYCVTRLMERLEIQKKKS